MIKRIIVLYCCLFNITSFYAQCSFNLGNDTTFCATNSTALNFTINGPTGYGLYIWNTGEITQNIIVNANGVYSCTAFMVSGDSVPNGNFSLGDTLFTTNYIHDGGGFWGELSDPGTYAVTTDPHLVHSNFQSFGDHTTGFGDMLVCNGSDVSNDTVWKATFAVVPGTTYSFSAWAASVQDITWLPDLAQLQFSINGVLIGPVYSPSSTGGEWTNFFQNWNSGFATSAIIAIVDQNTSGGGNDFALDDIFFQHVDCSYTDSIYINGGPPPVIIIQPSVICTGTTPVTLSATAPGGVWYGSGITDTTLGIFNQNTLSPGTYVIGYTTISGGCILNDTATIVVDTTPTVQISTPLPDACLSAPAFDLISYGYGSGGYWEGVGITNASLGTFHPALTGGTGTYLITYNITGACGLVTDSAYINVVSIYNSTITGPGSPCVNSSVLNLSAYTPGGVWSGSGIIDGATGAFDPSVSGVGIHEINYTISGLCGSSDTALINVLALPTADFMISPSATVSTNTVVNFTNTSIGAISWTWNFGDTASTTNTSNDQSPTHTYANAGTYCVLLTATNVNGCSDTTTYCLMVSGEVSIRIPNVFTPNGDGNNDVFYFEASGIKDLKCTVFDRWGIKVIELNGVGESNGWNGENKNSKAIMDGTYYYIIEATGLDNNIIKKEGFVQLIKE